MSENRELQANTDRKRSTEMKKAKITMECTLAIYMDAALLFSSVIR
jgi:hypothetical protein